MRFTVVNMFFFTSLSVPYEIQFAHSLSPLFRKDFITKQDWPSGLSKQKSIPNDADLELLKEEELKQFGKTRVRTKTRYEENQTAALALPMARDRLEGFAYNEEALLELCQDQIIEHANRRVDLFFYTLVAYYKTNYYPVLGMVNLQHGIGRSLTWEQGITEACHSSFLPSLTDKTIFTNEQLGKKDKCILSRTHFFDSINSTVELPCAVNRLDWLLEHHYGFRLKCLRILYEVSLGTLNPMEGLTVFLTLMDDILTDSNPAKRAAKKFNLINHSMWKGRRIPDRVLVDVAQGTFGTTFKPSKTVSLRYVDSLLRLSHLSPSTKDRLKQIMVLQKEILTEKKDNDIPAITPIKST